MSELVDALLSGLGAIGYALDTPGALLRGIMSGRPGSRASGRDMLESWGVLDPNEEGLDAGDVLGFGADMLVDPLSLFGAYKALRGLQARRGALAANETAQLHNLAVDMDKAAMGDLAAQLRQAGDVASARRQAFSDHSRAIASGETIFSPNIDNPQNWTSKQYGDYNILRAIGLKPKGAGGKIVWDRGDRLLGDRTIPVRGLTHPDDYDDALAILEERLQQHGVSMPDPNDILSVYESVPYTGRMEPLYRRSGITPTLIRARPEVREAVMADPDLFGLLPGEPGGKGLRFGGSMHEHYPRATAINDLSPGGLVPQGWKLPEEKVLDLSGGSGKLLDSYVLDLNATGKPEDLIALHELVHASDYAHHGSTMGAKMAPGLLRPGDLEAISAAYSYNSPGHAGQLFAHEVPTVLMEAAVSRDPGIADALLAIANEPGNTALQDAFVDMFADAMTPVSRGGVEAVTRPLVETITGRAHNWMVPAGPVTGSGGPMPRTFANLSDIMDAYGRLSSKYIPRQDNELWRLGTAAGQNTAPSYLDSFYTGQPLRDYMPTQAVPDQSKLLAALLGYNAARTPYYAYGER